MALDFDAAIMLRAMLQESEQAKASSSNGSGASSGAVIDLEDLPSGMKF